MIVTPHYRIMKSGRKWAVKFRKGRFVIDVKPTARAALAAVRCAERVISTILR
jgi:hypothetical protein